MATDRLSFSNPYQPGDWRHPLFVAWQHRALQTLTGCGWEEWETPTAPTPTFAFDRDCYRIRLGLTAPADYTPQPAAAPLTDERIAEIRAAATDTVSYRSVVQWRDAAVGLSHMIDEVLGEVSRLRAGPLPMADDSPGTPSARFTWLLNELERRFPEMAKHSAESCPAPEVRALEYLDISLAELTRLRAGGAMGEVTDEMVDRASAAYCEVAFQSDTDPTQAVRAALIASGLPAALAATSGEMERLRRIIDNDPDTMRRTLDRLTTENAEQHAALEKITAELGKVRAHCTKVMDGRDAEEAVSAELRARLEAAEKELAAVRDQSRKLITDQGAHLGEIQKERDATLARLGPAEAVAMAAIAIPAASLASVVLHAVATGDKAHRHGWDDLRKAITTHRSALASPVTPKGEG